MSKANYCPLSSLVLFPLLRLLLDVRVSLFQQDKRQETRRQHSTRQGETTMYLEEVDSERTNDQSKSLSGQTDRPLSLDFSCPLSSFDRVSFCSGDLSSADFRASLFQQDKRQETRRQGKARQIIRQDTHKTRNEQDSTNKTTHKTRKTRHRTKDKTQDKA